MLSPEQCETLNQLRDQLEQLAARAAEACSSLVEVANGEGPVSDAARESAGLAASELNALAADLDALAGLSPDELAGALARLGG